MTTQQNNKYYVYRFLDNTNKVIYTGRTYNLEVRLFKHFGSRDQNLIKRNKRTEKIEYVSFNKKTYCALYEVFLINLWTPEFNTDSKYEEEIDPNLLDVEKLNWTSIDNSFMNDLKKRIYVSKTIYPPKKFSKKENDRFEILEEHLGLNLKRPEKIILTIMWRAKTINHKTIDTPFLLQKAKFSRSTLKIAITNLRNLGLIEVENNRTDTGNRVAYNNYYLTEGGGF